MAIFQIVFLIFILISYFFFHLAFIFFVTNFIIICAEKMLFHQFLILKTRQFNDVLTFFYFFIIEKEKWLKLMLFYYFLALILNKNVFSLNAVLIFFELYKGILSSIYIKEKRTLIFLFCFYKNYKYN